MSINKMKVLGINITINSREDILEETQKYLLQIRNPKSEIRKKDIEPFIIFTPNPEIINYAQKDDKFKEIVNSSQINIPDGAGVCFALKYLYKIEVKRLSGVDLMLDLCKLASQRSLTIGLIGGRSRVAVETLECLLKKYPGLKVKVLDEPEVEIKNKRLRHLGGDRMGSSEVEGLESIDILFVALGFPKQEYFINSIKYKRPLVMMAVGGSFDYLSGRVSRAPDWMKETGFEWLFRLIKEPWRLPRQIKGANFFIRVLTSK